MGESFNWKKCLICQQGSLKNLVKNPRNGLKSLADDLLKFWEIGELDLNLEDLVRNFSSHFSPTMQRTVQTVKANTTSAIMIERFQSNKVNVVSLLLRPCHAHCHRLDHYPTLWLSLQISAVYVQKKMKVSTCVLQALFMLLNLKWTVK